MFLTSIGLGGSDSILALLQQPGQGGPFKDWLGYIIVFFVVVWPIIRGALDSARERRKEFETKSNERPGTQPRKRPQRTLEEIIQANLEDAHPVSSGRAETMAEVVPERRPKKAPAFGDRPADESLAPVYDSGDLFGDGSGAGELAGDPFDESALDLELVPESELGHVPSEDEMEAGVEFVGGDLARSRASTPTTSGGAGSRRGSSTQGHVAPLHCRVHPDAMFRRVGHDLSPWQRALILKEVLGTPLASRPTPSLTDYPDP